MRLVFSIVLATAAFVFGGCRDKQEVIEPSGPPPLPPASGTAVGYLVDAASTLQLRNDQLDKLKDIDNSLAARNSEIDVQLRQIEKPAPAEQLSPQQMKAGVQPQRYNNAPGASTIGTQDSQRLHRMRADNDREALEKALALMDPDQLVHAKRILQDRGVELPGAGTSAATHDGDAPPLPGAEP